VAGADLADHHANGDAHPAHRAALADEDLEGRVVAGLRVFVGVVAGEGVFGGYPDLGPTDAGLPRNLQNAQGCEVSRAHHRS